MSYIDNKFNKNSNKDVVYTDYNIKASKVRVVNDDGSSVVMSRDDAIDKAHTEGKNLVQTSFNKNVFPSSVCKIIDYSKFKYEQKKKAKELAKKNKAVHAELKEISFTIRIDTNDKNIKINHIKEFLADGSKVCISVFLSKREMNRIEYAKDLIKEILSSLDGIAELDRQPSFEGKKMSCFVRPIKK